MMHLDVAQMDSAVGREPKGLGVQVPPSRPFCKCNWLCTLPCEGSRLGSRPRQLTVASRRLALTFGQRRDERMRIPFCGL